MKVQVIRRISRVFSLCFIVLGIGIDVGYCGEIIVAHGGGYHHGHGYNHHGWYGRGGFYYAPGYYPPVIYNYPPVEYYAPQCEQVEVCDSYGECWLERYCN